jgi:Ca-activated chloride channel family protein
VGRFGPAVALSLAAAVAAQQTPTFSVDVKLVNVIATVKDASGRPIGDLEKANFRVLAAGTPQEIAVFERRTDRPLSVALLFDASLSVAKELKFEQDAALRFVRKLLGAGSHPQDRVAVFRFSSEVDQVVGFTASLERLQEALYLIRPDSGTSVYDALYLAAEALERRDGRKVVIIVTDGGDTTSTTTYHRALEALQLADTVVYSVIVVPVTSDAGRNLGGENALKTIAGSTGGLWFRQHAEQDLDRTFEQILRDLRVQYLLGFYPRGIPAGGDRFRRLEIRVDRSGVQVLARNGYYETRSRP